MPAPRFSAAHTAARGFTLLELLVVLTIIAIATAGVGLALRDSDRQALERDAERLVALLEGGRAWSRTSGQPLKWVAQPQGFEIVGRQPPQAAERWLSQGVEVEAPVTARAELVLGPEPILPAQSVVLRLRDQRLRVASDGLRPFAVAQP